MSGLTIEIKNIPVKQDGYIQQVNYINIKTDDISLMLPIDRSVPMEEIMEKFKQFCNNRYITTTSINLN